MTTSLSPTAEAVLNHLCRNVVTDPDAVEIDSNQVGDVVKFEVSVADEDMGRIIGRRGRVASAIRTVVSAAATKDDVEVRVEFVE